MAIADWLVFNRESIYVQYPLSHSHLNAIEETKELTGESFKNLLDRELDFVGCDIVNEF